MIGKLAKIGSLCAVLGIVAFGAAGESGADEKAKPKPKPEKTEKTEKTEKAPTTHQPTNEIEKISLRNSRKAVDRELANLQDRCGFTVPVDIVYDVPMKEWIAAEEWGMKKGCATDASSGGCVHLSWCGTEVVRALWFNYCGYSGQGPKTEFKGWDKKVKRLVCRGESVPAGMSRQDSKYSKMSADLAEDGTLTVRMHPSDANISNNFSEWLRPRLAAD